MFSLGNHKSSPLGLLEGVYYNFSFVIFSRRLELFSCYVLFLIMGFLFNFFVMENYSFFFIPSIDIYVTDLVISKKLLKFLV